MQCNNFFSVVNESYVIHKFAFHGQSFQVQKVMYLYLMYGCSQYKKLYFSFIKYDAGIIFQSGAIK